MGRVSWIDNLRGMSILAVIFMHCTIAVNGYTGHFSALSEGVNTLLQPVRLGLMFFVSGLFVDRGIKKGISRYLRNKILSILYPFFVWVAIYGGMKILFSRYSNHPQSPINILVSHLTGGGDITWFLHSLFVFFIVILLVRNIKIYWVISACILLSWLLPAIPDGVFASFDNRHINKSVYLFTFFFLGDFLVRHHVDIPRLCQNKRLVGGSLLAFIILSCLNILMTDKIAPPLLTPLALLAIPLFVRLAMTIRWRPVLFIGQNSIVFYLTHYLVIQVCAKLWKQENGSLLSDDLRFMVVFVASLALPVAVCRLRKRGWLNVLFTAKPSVPVPAR